MPVIQISEISGEAACDKNSPISFYLIINNVFYRKSIHLK